MTAQDILDSTIWKETLERTHDNLIARFELLDPCDSENLGAIAYKLRALADIAQALETE
jgi:hypothetical protein